MKNSLQSVVNFHLCRVIRAEFFVFAVQRWGEFRVLSVDSVLVSADKLVL